MKNVIEKVKSLSEIEAKGAFAFVAVTTKEALKKSRKTKLPTPANLSVVTCVRACTVSLGNDYEDAVNRRLAQEGKDADFAAGSSYCERYSVNGLVYKHKEREDFYLRVYPNLAVSFKTVVRYFDANGAEITDIFKSLEAEYFALKGGNENQGLDNPVLVNNYKLENVKYLKRGEIHLDELTDEIVSITKGE